MFAKHLATKLLGLAALASLAGCATSPRSYYSEGGDYYYGAPRADVIVDYSSSYGYPGWSYGLGGYGGGYGYGYGYGGYGGYYGGGFGYGYSPWWNHGGYYGGWTPGYPQTERRSRVDPDIAFRQGETGRQRSIAPRSAAFAPERSGAPSTARSERTQRAFAPQRRGVPSSGFAPTTRSGMSDNRMAPLSGVGARVQNNPPPAAASRRSFAPRNDALQTRSAPIYRSAPPAPSRAPSAPSRSQSAPTRK